jgi:signal transduction histidine kinase
MSGPPRRRLADALVIGAVRVAGLVVIVAAVYALVVLGIGSVPSSGQWRLLGFSALAAAIVALLYAAVQDRLAAAGERLAGNEQSAVDDLVRSFGGRAVRGLPLAELLLQLAEALRRTLSLSRAEVWTSAAGLLQLAASDPAAEARPIALERTEELAAVHTGVVGRAWLELWLPELLGASDAPLRAVPMVHGGELLGLIVVARAPGAPEFGADDEAVLTQLARQAALAVRNARLGSALEASLEELRRQADELRESRARVVAAGDAERRRIERDLHDGAQQQLVGLAVSLRVARELAATDPEQAEQMLGELAVDIHEAIEQVRELAHGIYPPLLADRGLRDAVRAALRRSASPSALDCDGIDRYSPDVEATVYFCCVEAIQNASKHAGPEARLTVRLWEEDASLLFEVADNGAGFDPATPKTGVGLTNMHDRVGAQGGRIRIEAAPGSGTRVVGVLPLGTQPS